MVIPMQCEKCGRSLEVDDKLAGKRVKCSCGKVFEVGGTSEIMEFFSEELDIRDDPLLAETPHEWAKATGAPPEIAEQLEKRIAPKFSSNPAFMMALTGGILAVMLIIGLIAFLLARKPSSGEGAWMPAERTVGVHVRICASLGFGPSADTLSRLHDKD